MSQVIVYGNTAHLTANRTTLSDTIHGCLVDALKLPADKRFHRFIRLEPEDFIYPADRSDRYTIIEISMFEGRDAETRKTLIRLLCERLQTTCDLGPRDVEITIFETPRANWGIRGLPADELGLTYKVNV